MVLSTEFRWGSEGVAAKEPINQEGLSSGLKAFCELIVKAGGTMVGVDCVEIAQSVIDGAPEKLSDDEAGKVLDESTIGLWWANKELDSEEPWSRYAGSNEKTTLIVKVSRAGGHAPVSEPAVDEETRKRMMGIYYKKQETQKALLQDKDVTYTRSEWAASNTLKESMQGLPDMSRRGIRFK